jgi:hypothetical protein
MAPAGQNRREIMAETPQKPAKDSAAARQQRLGQALRDNLKRRKSQSRGRASQPADASPAAADELADIYARPADPDRD